MKTFMGALVFSSFILLSSVTSNPGRTLKSRNGPAKKIITMAYLLDKNDFYSNDATRNSAVGKWLKKVNKKAQGELKNAVDVSIQLKITAINEASEELSIRLKAWLNEGHVYGEWILDFVKEESVNMTANPDITCVLTRHTIYNDLEEDMLAYTRDRSLCVSMVPMILTYREDEASQSGERLSELIRNSTTSDFKEALKTCKSNKPRPQGNRRLLYSQ
uniref:Putative secreted protein n=1 Tax=Ixodes ricinus TaxID=34613 RepID=V5H270_IXORI